MKRFLHGALATVFLFAGAVVSAPPAGASVSLTPVPDFASLTAPGQSASAQFTIHNTSFGPGAEGTVTVTGITLTPSCGNTAPGCTQPDPDVFRLDGPFVGSASPGAVCPSSYTMTLINPGTGEVRFTPNDVAPVLDVNESCTISFTTTTLRVPSIDQNSGTPGVQTAVLGAASGHAENGNFGGGFGTSVQTVDRASTGIAVQASPQQLTPGQSFTATSTVAGPPSAPTPAGSVTFSVFGPASGSPTCTGAPVFTATAPLAPSGPGQATATSPPFAPSAPGFYSVVASYSGDANHLPSNTSCGDPNGMVEVRALPTIRVDLTATPLSRPEPGGMFTYQVEITNTSATEPVTITSLTDDVYGNLATQGTCTTALGTVLPGGGGTYTCQYPGSFTGSAGASQTNVATATAVDQHGNTATAGDDAVVSITAAPGVLLELTATPTSRPEPGGTFTFDVLVRNTGSGAATITSLTDNVYGNVATRGTCTTAIGTVLPSGGTYACSFPGDFFGPAGASQTNVSTVVVSASDGSTATDADGATVRLTPSGPPPAVSVSGGSGPEADDATFTLTLDRAPTSTFTVDYATVAGTAGPADFTPTTGTATFSAGQTSQTVTVPVTNDLIDENAEHFRLQLSGATGGTIATSSATWTITDDDPPSRITVNDVSVVEGDSGTRNMTFTVRLNRRSAKSISVNFGTARSSAVPGSDYVARSGSLTFAPGQLTKTVTVAVKGDTVREGNEVFFLILSGATNATIRDASGAGGIVDDD